MRGMTHVTPTRLYSLATDIAAAQAIEYTRTPFVKPSFPLQLQSRVLSPCAFHLAPESEHGSPGISCKSTSLYQIKCWPVFGGAPGERITSPYFFCICKDRLNIWKSGSARFRRCAVHECDTHDYVRTLRRPMCSKPDPQKISLRHTLCCTSHGVAMYRHFLIQLHGDWNERQSKSVFGSVIRI